LLFIHADVGNLPFERSFTDDFVACLDLNDLFVCNEEIHKKRKFALLPSLCLPV
jgi:hypothetical protein